MAVSTIVKTTKARFFTSVLFFKFIIFFSSIIVLMSLQLLVTKLSIPQLHQALTERNRLIQKMNAGLGRRLSLISAPAGFGKTTLVADWLNRLPFSPHPWELKHCSWISLDEQDNDPVRFLRYFIAAIQATHPDLGGALLDVLDNAPKPNFQAITQDLLNEIADCKQPLLVIFDDYHEIHNPDIHQILQTLIDFLPAQVHFIIATRQDPPLSLPRWRARSWLSEITVSDLRFNQTEASIFLHHTMQLELDQAAVALLEKCTEGWVTGLQLAALSLADTDFSLESIQQFGGQDRYIAEYLLTEVFDLQPAEIQQFLLPTSILDRFNADLCATVLYPEDTDKYINLIQTCQNRIETLERMNLFVTPLDRQRVWYRYHHLFAQLLRQRLERNWTPDDIHVLYRRAAHWYANHDYIEESINHALKGEDYVFTAGLIADLDIDSLWNQSSGTQLRTWGAALPLEVLIKFPKATLHIAIAHMTRNEIKEALHYIELVREDPLIHDEILLIDSILIRNKGDLYRALSLATEATELFEGKNKTMYIAAKTQVIICLMTLGDLRSAEDLATSLWNQIQTESEHYLNIYIQVNQALGLLKEQRGKLTEAERIYLDGIESIKKTGVTMPLVGLLQVRLAAIYYQWNEIEKAIEFCETGLQWGERTGIADIFTLGLFVKIDLSIRNQDQMAIQASLDRLSKLLDWPEFNDLRSLIQANLAFVNLRLGDLNFALRWADSSGLALTDQVSLKYRAEYQFLVSLPYK